jgi:hypothetical protein
VVDQQLQLPGRFVVACGMQLRLLAQCCASDRQSVDRVGLAASPRSFASAGHQPRPDPQDGLAAG